MANIKVKRSAVPGKIPLTTDLQLGEFAVNTHDGKVYIKKNVSGVETVEAINTPALQNLQNRYSYAVSGSSQSTFSAQYVVPYVDVYLNGVHLASSDYIATNGTSVVLNTAAQVGDVVEIVALNSYTANSDFLNVPGGIATADFLKFDTTATNTPEVAKLNWNADEGTLEFGLKGGQVVLQVGQKQVQRIYNNTGSTLVLGQVVYVTGSQGNRLTVALASASSEATSTRTFGIVTETILNETEGFIATSGLVRGLNTSSFAEGSVLWLGTSAGTYTTTRPAAPNHGVLVGFVVRQHANVGSVFVHIANGYELDELHNVLIASKQDGQALVYEASSGLWKNKFVDYNTLLNKPTLVTQTDINNAIASLVDTAPATLDTLNELAAALGDDPNFATTVTNLVATKLSLSGGTMTGDITFSGTQTWPTFNQNTTGNAATSTTATNVSGGSASVTTLTTSSTVTLNGGTANGVAYLNGSKVLTTGSALTFDGNGNLTLGGSTPRLLSNMSGALASRFIIQNSTANGNTRVYLYPNGTGTISAINGTNNSDTGAADYQAFDLAVIGTTDVRLSSNATGSAAFLPLTFYTHGSEQMRLTSTGLGIGTSTIADKLAVAGTLYLGGRGASYALKTPDWRIYNSSTGNALVWDDYTTERMRLDSSGNLGLGVTTPSAWYSTVRAMQLGLTGSISANGASFGAFIGDNYYFSTGANVTRITTGPVARFDVNNGAFAWQIAGSAGGGTTATFTQAMTLDASGNWKLGTTSFGTRAVISGTNTAVGTTVSGSNTGLLFLYDTSAAANAGPEILMGSSYDGTNSIVGTSIKSYKVPGSGSGADQYDHGLIFKTSSFASGGLTERARIDSSGNLLVGTTSVTMGISGSETTLCLKGNSASKAASFVAVNAAGTGTSVFGTGDSTVACYAGTVTNHPFVFQTNNTERARIDSSGNLLVGVTTMPFGGGYSNGLSGLAASLGASTRQTKPLIWGSYSTSGGLPAISGNWASGGYWGIGPHSGTGDSTLRIGIVTADSSGLYWNGYANIQAGTYTNASDYRIKENVCDYDKGALARVLALRPVLYNLIPLEEGQPERTQIGFIAHEIQEHIPEVVTGVKDELDGNGEPQHQGVDYGKLTAVLVKAIQEQQAIITDLRARVAALEAA